MMEWSEKEKGESAIFPPIAVRERRQVRGERPLENPQRRGSRAEKRFLPVKEDGAEMRARTQIHKQM